MGRISPWRALVLAPLAALLCVEPARAAPTITPKVEQCDGTFTAGTQTNKDSPKIQAHLQDIFSGLKIGQQPPSLLTGTTALWRFDGNTVPIPSECASGVNPCPSLTTLGSQSSFTQGKFGRALIFYSTHTTNSYAKSGLTGSQWDLPADYTLSAWIQTGAGRGSTQTIVSLSDITSPGDITRHFWGFAISPSSTVMHFDSRESIIPFNGMFFSSGPKVIDGQWHYVAVVRRNGTDRRLFVDGLLAGTTVAQSTVTFSKANGNEFDNGARLMIGGKDTNNGGAANADFFNGSIDELRIHPSALSDQAIFLEYNASVHEFSSDSGVVYTTAAPAVAISSPSGTTLDVVYQPPTQNLIGSLNKDSQQKYKFYAQSSDGSSTVFSIPPYGLTVDKSAPGAPAMIGGNPTSPLDITWTWSAPGHLCGQPTAVATYTVVNSTSGSVVTPNGVPDGLSFSENFPFDPPNQLHARQVRVKDYWGTSVLSNSAAAYTRAAAPSALAATDISTGSLTLSWSAGNNPGYTRYEVMMSSDNFASAVSTLAAITDDPPLTAASIPVPNLSLGTTYYFRVRAANGRASDSLGGLMTPPGALTAISLPAAPSLGGTAVSESAVRWDWTYVAGAAGYRLYAAGDGSLIGATSSPSFPYSNLSTNTAYGAQIAAVNSLGAQGPLSSPIYVFTKSTQPVAPAIVGVATNTISYSWSPNGNPGYTLYELNVATDPAFAVVVATRITAQNNLAVGGLFPGSTYYARVRAYSGGQIPSAFALFGSTATGADASVALASSPASAYSPPSGTVGLWHFDESSGTAASDSSGFANPGVLTCLGAGCASTPTFAAGPPNLGTAVRFSGTSNSLVLISSIAAYNLSGSITVSAWADPASLAQPNGAAVVAQGTGTAEDFSLDVFGGKYRFLVNPGVYVVSTSTIRLNQWDYVVGVYDQDHSTASIYINGVLSNSVSVPARTYIPQPITIGSRQSGSGIYDLGFNGAIDEVRLISGALTPSQVLADYRGAFPAAAVLPLPNTSVRLILPPNAFGASAQIYASADPFGHPLQVSPAALADGLSNAPTGQALIAGSLIEIVPIVGGLPFTGNLGSSATLAIPYADADGDGLVDGTKPPIPAGSLAVYTLDTTVRRWIALPSTLDRAGRLMYAQTPHFSVFALFGTSTIGSSLSQIRVYPNPWKAASKGRFDAAGVTFDNLPADGSIQLFNLSGEKVNELVFSGAAAGRAVWNGKNSAGSAVASGVYFAYIKSSAGSAAAVVKFAIER